MTDINYAVEALVDALELDDDVTIHRKYSGRGMYGKTCIGFSGSNPLSTITEAMGSVVEDQFNSEDGLEWALEFFEMISSMRKDSLGLGEIIYFPGYDTVSAGGEDHEEV